jgi:hypothetical protein
LRRFFLPAAALILTLLLGFLLGRISAIASRRIPLTTIRPDTRSLIPAVQITGIADGELTGTIRGGARFIIGDRVVIPTGSGSFRIPPPSFLMQKAGPAVPAGMRFVASKRGKYYYPVGSTAAAKLSASNRVYFRDASVAEQAGFRAGR